MGFSFAQEKTKTKPKASASCVDGNEKFPYLRTTLSRTVAGNYELNTTIGELDKKLTTDIFTESDQKQYIEREKTLKKYLLLL